MPGDSAGTLPGSLDLSLSIPEDSGMALLMYFQSTRGAVPPILWLALLVVLYLAVIELRSLDAPRRTKVWWFSLVLLTHVFGYIVLRAWVFFRQRFGPA